jgi:hypothetical protein
VVLVAGEMNLNFSAKLTVVSLFILDAYDPSCEKKNLKRIVAANVDSSA